MKNLIIALWIILPLGLKAQQAKINCDLVQNENINLKNRVSALQQDTLFLRNKLAYYDKLYSNANYSLSSFSPEYTIKILNCTGDRGAQTVKIDFVLHHKRVNQKVILNGQDGNSNAYDEIGNTFNVKEVSLGTNRDSWLVVSMVPTDIDVRGYIIFRGVLGGTDRLKLVQFFIETKDSDGELNKIAGKVDIRNLKIDWQ